MRQVKKKQSRSKTKLPQELAAQLEKQRMLVAQQEHRGHFGTYDHIKLARLEAAAAEYEQNDEVNE